MSPSAITELAQHEPDSAAALSNGGHLSNGYKSASNGSSHTNGLKQSDMLFGRHLHKSFPVVKSGKGNYLYLADGRTIFDASTGAAVSCLGHDCKRVINAVSAQMNTGISYLASAFWSCDIVDELCKELINGTGGRMSRVYLTGSGELFNSNIIDPLLTLLGSEAMEAAVKLSRQYFYENDKNTPRVNFIARNGSYHGNTIGALGISGFVGRRAPYEPFLMKNVHHISACNPYRQRLERESDTEFVSRKVAELEAKFQELGPETVIAFIMEPVVGAALGCVPSVPGYIKAMKEICHKHGALFILDEVMCGMGRCGTLHAWQGEDVAPDLQTMGKGLGGGYQPIAAVLISEKVVTALMDGSGQFVHGQTYQGMPVQAAAALEVQRIQREKNLVGNVQTQGAYLERRLKSLLGSHPNVGDIRGRGLFWGIEFVADKATKKPFDPKLEVAQRVHQTAISAPFNMTLYHGTGTADGVRGDHVIIAPTYIVTKEDIEHIVQTTSAVIHQVFEKLGRS
jgi:adenosylmethionine-8-amino-7-oxononanoate aminotransferase